MQGRIRELHEPFAGAWEEPPWPLAIEMAHLMPPGSWSLVGGLMVQVHGMLSGIEKLRSTEDVDGALTVRSGIRFGKASRILQGAGFELNTRTAFAYNFTRGDEMIDLLVADLFSPERHPKSFGRPLFAIPGGARAMMEPETVVLLSNGTEAARIETPSLKGAIVLKGGAYRSDSRDPNRHLEDGVVLLSCVRDPEQIRAGLSLRSRKRVRALLHGLRSSSKPWVPFDGSTRARARLMLEEMIVVFDLDGVHGFRPPGA